MSSTTLLAGVIFGSIGVGAFIYGKKQMDFKVLTIGVVLCAYPYFVSNVWALYGIGIVLTAGLFFFHD